MSFIFKEKETKKIYLAKGEKQSLKLALDDFIKDIERVCGFATLTDNKDEADVFVCSKESEEFEALSEGKAMFSHCEEFCYFVNKGKLYFFGENDLGAMWALYTFSERELKIPPFYIFDDIQIEKKPYVLIEEKKVQEYPHTKFRGWFINDEDLLCGFKSKGHRVIDYPFYSNVIHPSLMEKIVETALRFRINLLIPSTFIDIHKPAEEEIIDIVTKRGLYVSQHHIEPMGVSHFAYADFVKEYGYPEVQSFTTNSETMIACWEHYAKKWAKYPRVIWQLGLRGKGDTPVWKTDSSVGSGLKERGELLSRAIKTQYDIVKKHVKGEIYSTSTVWMEGAKLLQSGYLKLPEDTISVFADIGMNHMFGDDFFTVPREDKRKYGIYYHSQYWHTGPHLSEGALPQKIDYSYRLTRENQSDYYAILNASNIKEFTFSININANLMWYGEKTTLDDIINNYCKTYAGEFAGELKDGIESYYLALGDIGEDRYRAFCNKYEFSYHRYENLDFPISSLNDGIMCVYAKKSFEEKCELYTSEFRSTVIKGIELSKNAYNKFTLLEEKLKEGYSQALKKQWRWQSYYWFNLFSFAKEICDAIEEFKTGKTDNIANHLEAAASFIKNILDTRKAWYTGKWADWFKDERKLNIQYIYDFTLKEKERFEAN